MSNITEDKTMENATSPITFYTNDSSSNEEELEKLNDEKGNFGSIEPTSSSRVKVPKKGYGTKRGRPQKTVDWINSIELPDEPEDFQQLTLTSLVNITKLKITGARKRQPWLNYHYLYRAIIRVCERKNWTTWNKWMDDVCEEPLGKLIQEELWKICNNEFLLAAYNENHAETNTSKLQGIVAHEWNQKKGKNQMIKPIIATLIYKLYEATQADVVTREKAIDVLGSTLVQKYFVFVEECSEYPCLLQRIRLHSNHRDLFPYAEIAEEPEVTKFPINLESQFGGFLLDHAQIDSEEKSEIQLQKQLSRIKTEMDCVEKEKEQVRKRTEEVIIQTCELKRNKNAIVEKPQEFFEKEKEKLLKQNEELVIKANDLRHKKKEIQTQLDFIRAQNNFFEASRKCLGETPSAIDTAKELMFVNSMYLNDYISMDVFIETVDKLKGGFRKDLRNTNLGSGVKERQKIFSALGISLEKLPPSNKTNKESLTKVPSTSKIVRDPNQNKATATPNSVPEAVHQAVHHSMPGAAPVFPGIKPGVSGIVNKYAITSLTNEAQTFLKEGKERHREKGESADMKKKIRE